MSGTKGARSRRGAGRGLAVAAVLAALAACGPAESESEPGAEAGDAASPAGSATESASDEATRTTTPTEHLESVWADAGSYGAFVDEARRRRATWLDNTARAEVPEELVARLEAAGGGWRILAVAEDWCGDSAHTLPYVAALADSASGVELRVVRSAAGETVLEDHPTPDGRAATPVFVLMDADGRERGCLVERPPGLQAWFLAAAETLEEDELMSRKYAWYEEDAGAATIEEMVRVVEAAAAGEDRCLGVDGRTDTAPALDLPSEGAS